MALKDQIDLIISERKKKGDNLRKRKDELTAVKLMLKNSSAELTTRAKGIKDDELRKQYISVVSSLNTKESQKQLDHLIRKMDEGIKRFDRDYISIATIGKEGQGKSRFLQSVGDIGNDIIPAYDGTSCTGAASIIWNDPRMPKGSVRTTITFRQPSELLTLVKPYILALDPEYYENNTLLFDDIGYINLTALSLNMKDGNADQATALKHLTNIVENFDNIRDLFGAEPLTLTDPELIKTYVAQSNGKHVDADDYKAYFNYLAVARADIYCPFYADAGKIRLVDTVGIGATQFGIEEAMLSTVDKECDAAIVVTKPDTRAVQDVDIRLYNSLRNRFELRDTSKWLFYLVNHHIGHNDYSIKPFCDGVRGYNFAVADCRIVDSSNQTAVRDDFVMPMLQILVRNMDAIDSAYMREIDEHEKAARAEIKKCVDNLPALEVVNTNSMLGKEAYEKGKKCFDRMTADLNKLVYKWSQEKDRPNSVLWNNVQSILNSLDNLIPSPEQIQAISDNNGALLGDDIWKMALHYVRNAITDRFILIDDVLEKATLDFKNSLVGSLYYELKALSSNNNTAPNEGEKCDMVEWLKYMMDGILSSNKQYEQIHKAFNFLYRFEFNTRAQLIQEVRRQMYIINPICAGREYAKPDFDFDKNNCGDAIHFYLTSRMSVIEDELRYHLSKLYKTPNLAFYAAAEEFYDRLTFASDLSGNSLTSMSDVWGMFFQEYSSKLWKEDSERYDAVNKLIDSYNGMIASLEEFLGATPA